MTRKYDELPNDETINKTAESLKNHGMEVFIVDSGKDAKAKLFDIIPSGAEVMAMTSVTLDTIGASDEINKSGNYVSARNLAFAMDQKTQSKEIARYRSLPNWTTGSCHAVTEDGSIMVASQSGSQLAAYTYGADKVVFVIGAQKIVKDIPQGFDRIYKHSLVLESERAHIAYGVKASAVNKIFILNQEIAKDRIKVILVKEVLGF